MKLKVAYVQAQQGIPATVPNSRAWEGFRSRGVGCELFEPRQIEHRTLPLARNTHLLPNAAARRQRMEVAERTHKGSRLKEKREAEEFGSGIVPKKPSTRLRRTFRLFPAEDHRRCVVPRAGIRTRFGAWQCV